MPQLKATNANALSFKKPKFFYGYWIIVTAFFCAFVNSGCGFYAFSFFVKPLQAEFGWGRGKIMLGLTLFFLIAGVAAPAVGRLVDRYGAKKTIAIGAFTSGFGFIFISQVDTLRFFYGGYILAGLGMAAAGLVPGTTLISNWFKKWRGTAVGIMSAGLGAGGLAFAPIIGGYLIPHFGWRVSYLALASVTWMLIPLALFVIKTKPEDVGLLPDGEESDASEFEKEISTSEFKGITLKKAFSTATLWLLAVSFFAHGFSEVGILQTHVPYLADMGLPMSTASTFFGMVGFFSLVGKFFFGWLCDRIKPKYACIIGLGVELSGLLILFGIKPSSPTILFWLYAIVMGIGVGSWLPTMSMMVSGYFGLIAYGTIFGVISFTMSFGAATGPLFSGYIFDVTGNYHWAFVIFIITYCLSIATVWLARRPQ